MLLEIVHVNQFRHIQILFMTAEGFSTSGPKICGSFLVYCCFFLQSRALKILECSIDALKTCYPCHRQQFLRLKNTIMKQGDGSGVLEHVLAMLFLYNHFPHFGNVAMSRLVVAKKGNLQVAVTKQALSSCPFQSISPPCLFPSSFIRAGLVVCTKYYSSSPQSHTLIGDYLTTLLLLCFHFHLM